MGNMFGVKDPIPDGLRSRVAVMPVMSAKQPGIFPHRVREHLFSDKASHIFKHLHNSEHIRALCSVDCFNILDHASTSFQLKIK